MDMPVKEVVLPNAEAALRTRPSNNFRKLQAHLRGLVGKAIPISA